MLSLISVLSMFVLVVGCLYMVLYGVVRYLLCLKLTVKEELVLLAFCILVVLLKFQFYPRP